MCHRKDSHPMSAAPPPNGRPAVPGSEQHPLLSAWPRSAQNVLIYLLGIATAVIAMQAYGQLSWPRPTDLSSEPESNPTRPAVQRRPNLSAEPAANVTRPVADGAPSEPVTVKEARLRNKVVDVNQATLEDLQLLPGIGPKLAQRIIDEREKKPFANVDDLRRVYGIGAKTLEKLRPYVTVGSPPVRVADAE
jgi:competence ComEA-like helix-hairpin-helix protein